MPVDRLLAVHFPRYCQRISGASGRDQQSSHPRATAQTNPGPTLDSTRVWPAPRGQRRPVGGMTGVSGVAQVAAANATLLADLAQHCPRLARGATVATVLVRLTELAALVLPVGRVSHRGSDP